MFQGGSVAAEYGGIVTPVFNCSEFLQPPEWITGALSVTAIGSNTVIAMDPTERLLLHHFGWQTDSVVNITNTRFQIGANVLVGTSTKVEIHTQKVVSSDNPAGTIAGDMTNYPNPLYLENIESFRVYAKQWAGAGNTDISFGFLVQKIKI